VADTDDYFDYEQPLDFVTRAERKKLLKEAKGDEKLANKLLVERTNAPAGVTTEQAKALGIPAIASTNDDDSAKDDNSDNNNNNDKNQMKVMEKGSPENDTAVHESEVESAQDVEVVTSKVEHVEEPKVKPKKGKKVPKKPSPTKATKIVQASDDDLDVLGI
jgi:hypothetical protein